MECVIYISLGEHWMNAFAEQNQFVSQSHRSNAIIATVYLMIDLMRSSTILLVIYAIASTAIDRSEAVYGLNEHLLEKLSKATIDANKNLRSLRGQTAFASTSRQLFERYIKSRLAISSLSSKKTLQNALARVLKNDPDSKHVRNT